MFSLTPAQVALYKKPFTSSELDPLIQEFEKKVKKKKQPVDRLDRDVGFLELIKEVQQKPGSRAKTRLLRVALEMHREYKEENKEG